MWEDEGEEVDYGEEQQFEDAPTEEQKATAADQATEEVNPSGEEWKEEA